MFDWITSTLCHHVDLGYWCSIALGLVVLYLVVVLFLGEPEVPHDASGTNAIEINQSVTCGSDHCVRCNKYSHLQARSQQKLQEYISKKHGDSSGLERLIEATENYQHIPPDVGPQRPNVLHMKCLQAIPWWTGNTKVKKQCDVIEARYDAILQEYLMISLLSHVEGGGWTKNTTPSGSWETFYIYNQGAEITANSERCPVVTSLVQNTLQDSCMEGCVFGNVFFSKLYPGTQITPHYGPTNVRLRCHLGLKVPPGWFLTVHGEARHWEPQSCIVFDDSFLHSVSHCSEKDKSDSATQQCSHSNTQDNSYDISGQNVQDAENSEWTNSNSDCRVVLILDLWHPEISVSEKQALCAVYGAE